MSRYHVSNVLPYEDDAVAMVMFRVEQGEISCFRAPGMEKGLSKKERGPRLGLDWEDDHPWLVQSIEISEEGQRVVIRAGSHSVDLDLSSEELESGEVGRTWMRILLSEIVTGSRCVFVDRDGTPEAPEDDPEIVDFDEAAMSPEQRELVAIVQAIETRDSGELLPTDIAKLEDLVARNPDFMEARGALGSALMQLGECGKAIPHLERAARDANDAETESELLGFLAQALGAVERHEEALPWHRRRLELSPDQLPAVVDYFATLLNLGRFDEVLAEADRLERPKWRRVFFLTRGDAMLQLRRLDDAVGWFRKYEKENPKSPEIQARLAEVYLLRGDREKARKACERAEKYADAPGARDSVPLLGTLAALWHAVGDEAAMRRMIKRLRKIDPAIAEALEQGAAAG